MAVLFHHIRTPPDPPSIRTELPIPEGVDRLVLACLAKDPAERPQNARALRGELDRLVTPPWTAERADAWWSMHHPAVGESSSGP